MAFGLKHWTGLTLAGCAAVALSTLPPSAPRLHQSDTPLQEEVRYKALRRDALLANETLVRLRRADDLIARTLLSGEPVIVGVPTGVPESEAHFAEEQAQAEVEAVGSDRADVALGLFYLVSGEGGYPGAPNTFVSDAEYYFGERNGRAYCVTTVPTLRRWQDGSVSDPGVRHQRSRLGLCQVVARFGLPGPSATKWLGAGASVMGASPAVSDKESPYLFSRWGLAFERRMVLGLPTANLTLAQDRCFAGLTEGCATMFLDPAGEHSLFRYYVRTGPEPLIAATPLSAVHENSAMVPSDYHVLADLVAEFGEDRFRQWWTSEGDLGEAFERTFGTDPGVWYLDRAKQLVNVTRPGPLVSGRGLLGVLLLMMLGAVVGGGWARRRSLA